MAELTRRVRVTLGRVFWVLLVLVAVILVAQNSADTTIQVFGWTVQAPLFLVILVAMLLGWAIGTIGHEAWSLRRRRGSANKGEASKD